VLTDMLLDVKNKEGNESAAMILRHILCNMHRGKIKPISA
ncbi:hypothetical protein AVEN_55737-1, partial [Araneus ventricosus]